MKARLDLLWFDFWVGLYLDRAKKILYINPFPMIVFSITHDRNTFIGGKWVDRDQDSETRLLYGEKYSNIDRVHSVVGWCGLLFFGLLYAMLMMGRYTPAFLVTVILGSGTIFARAVLDMLEDG